MFQLGCLCGPFEGPEAGKPLRLFLQGEGFYLQVHRAHSAAEDPRDVAHDDAGNFGVHLHECVESGVWDDGDFKLTVRNYGCGSGLVVDEGDFPDHASGAELGERLIRCRFDLGRAVEAQRQALDLGL